MAASKQVKSRQGRTRDERSTTDDREIALAVALDMLSEGGIAALSVRRLATRLGMSYQIIYTLFGGKAGLLDALVGAGFARLASACRANAPAINGAEGVVAVVLAYRDFALANRDLYDLMFGNLPGVPRSERTTKAAADCFGTLLHPVQRYYGAHPDSRALFDTAEQCAMAIWTTTHGHIDLEFKSWFGFEHDSRQVLRAAIHALLAAETTRTNTPPINQVR